MLVPAITSCGRCGPCKVGMAAHCEAVGGIGWIFGHLIDGVQAEFARVPYAETSVHLVPEGVSDEQVLFLADILPTGYEIGVQNGGVQAGRHDRRRRRRAGRAGGDDDRRDRRRGPDHRGRHGALTAQARRRELRRDAHRGRRRERRAGDPRHHRGRRRRRRDGGGRRAGHVRPLHADRPRGRNRGQHRRPRLLDHAAPRGALDQEHHDHDGPGQRLDRPDAAQARPRRADRGREARHPPLRARRRSRRPTTCSAPPASTTR